MLFSNDFANISAFVEVRELRKSFMPNTRKCSSESDLPDVKNYLKLKMHKACEQLGTGGTPSGFCFRDDTNSHDGGYHCGRRCPSYRRTYSYTKTRPQKDPIFAEEVTSKRAANFSIATKGVDSSKLIQTEIQTLVIFLV